MSSISAEKWRKVKEIFYAALQLAPAERERFLDESCKGDEDLRREVESLLASSEAAGSFMQNAAAIEVPEAFAETGAKLHVGQNLNHYRIFKLLGRGGMGEVYLAEDTKLKRRVALKVLPAALSDDKDRLRRFEQEARAASALNHPNILTIHEIGKADDTYFIVSEFVEGETLREKLRGRVLPLGETLDLGVQAASALAAAHASGIIHRDIKSENIIVRADGLVKILDFGLAKLTANQPVVETEAETLAQVKTASGVILGTAAYMSPEQARGKQTDARTDVFSLGVVIYEMIAGRQPFAGETMSDTLAAILKSEPAPLSEYISDIPPELEKIVGKALRKNADERYQHIKDLLIDLRDLKQDLEFAAQLRRSAPTKATAGNAEDVTNVQTAQTTSMAQHLAGEIKNHKLASIAALLALVVGISALYYFTRGNISNKQTSNAPIDSIAVLPFANAAQDPNAEYLSDGITESLINDLSQLSNLKVMSSSSVFRYKDKEQDAQKIGHELNVRAVLTGSVKQIGDQLIINVSLDDVKDNHRIWGEQYVRKFADVLAVQNEIAQEVSSNLRVKLTGAEQQQLAKRYTENAEAYQLYLKGMYEWKKHTQEDLQKAIEYFKQAKELDPNYALAYSGLSASYGVLGNSYLPPRESFPEAKAYAAKAVALDDTLAEAHSAMGAVRLYYDWDFAEAQKELKRAQSLDPNDAAAHHLYADSLEIMGRFDEAKAERDHALKLDPLSPLYNMADGATLYFAHQDEEAIAQFEKTINLEPRFVLAYLYLGEAYEQKKMYAQAIATYQKGMTQAERHPLLIAALGHAYAVSGERGKANQTLNELRELSKRRYVTPYLTAIIYLGLGDKEQAFAWLDKASQDRSSFLIWLKVEPLFDPLRDDPRFQNLLRRVGLMP